MKRFLCLVAAGIMTISMGSVCMAAEEDVVYGNEEEVIIEHRTDEAYTVVDRKMMTDGYSRASWGEGLLHVSTPLMSNPSGYAETRTYSGTAYYLYARTILIDDDSIHYDTEKGVYSESTVCTAELLSPTKKCEFSGEHKIRDTSSSGWQECRTYKKVS